jgi:L-alanine-DL-glutamate epimerase-like enolase superfamily enzyme
VDEKLVVTEFEKIAELPLEIESYSLEGLAIDVSSAFTRRTTVIRLAGRGEEGVGEDVTYDGDAQLALQEARAVLPLAGRFTLATFSERVGELDLFPDGASRAAFANYRRWAFESAALDLALRQAGRSLAETLGREVLPVRFVNSRRLGDPPSVEPLRRWLDLYPDLRFKLDATSSWDEELIAEIAALGIVDSIDLKGAYEGTPVDQGADPVLYERVANAFPDAWLEDPALTPETDAVLAPHRERITWDAPIHSVADVEALPFPPRTINLKPSRFGSLSALFDAYDYCAERGIAPYGGGQFELGPGRGQIQYLASLFHPDASNDVAPGGYNATEPVPGLPTSPLPPRQAPTGFSWS